MPRPPSAPTAARDDGTSAPEATAARIPAALATGLGLGHTAVSGYWLLGGTALLDTIGGSIEEWGRQRSAWACVAFGGVVALKAVVASSAVLYAGVGTSVLPSRLFDLARHQWARRLGWIAAVVLIVYGGVLTAAGLMIEVGTIDPAPDANLRALAWHTYLWDPWFLAWGVALAVTLRATTPSGRPVNG